MAGKVLKSFAWDFSGRIISQVVSLIVSIILARILSPAEFGLVGMSMVFIAMSGLFTNLGLASALIQRSEPEEIHYSSAFFLNIWAAAFLTAIFILIAPLIARFFNNNEITNLIRILALSLLITSFSTVQEARLRKAMRFNVLAKARIFGAGVSGTIGISMAITGFGVWSLVAQTIIGRLVVTIYYWFISSWRPKLQFQFRAIKELWSFSLNLLIAGIIDTIYRQLDSLIIAKLFTATDLGLFSKAKSLNQFVIKYSSQSVDTVTFPALAKIKNDNKKLIDKSLKAETFIAFTTFCLLGWLFVSAESLILTLLGPKWEASIEMFRLLCLSGFVYPVSSASLNMLKASGDSRSFLRIEVIKKIIGLMGLTVGFMFGLRGYLISLVITGIISVLVNMYYTGRSLNISVGHQLLPLAPYLIIGVIISLLIEIINLEFKIHFITFIFSTIVYFGLYFIVNQLLKTEGFMIFMKEINNLREALKKRFEKKNIKEFTNE